MSDVFACMAAVAIFFGAIALRGIFGYLKNKQISIEDLKFDWKKFLKGSIRPILMTISIGALAGIIICFLNLVDATGVEISGLDEISVHNLLVGLMIADIGAIGYAIKEGLILFGLSDDTIKKIREVSSEGTAGILVEVSDDGDIVASAETVTEKSDKEQLDEDEVEVEHGEEIGKGAAWVNTYPEPYRSARKDSKIDPSTCYNRECVSYVAWKICEAVGSWPKRTGDMNAKNWIYRLPSWGYKKVSSPREGGLYVGVLPSGKYGHVVWFEYGNTISEYNYGSTGNYSVRNINLGQYSWFEIKAPAVSPAPATEQANNNRYKVGDTVSLGEYRDYYGKSLARTRDSYTISEIKGDRAVLTADGVVYAAVNTNNLRSVESLKSLPRIGDHVKTKASVDGNGNKLNLAIINDGNSVWASTNSKGLAVLSANGVIRCAVPVDSLYV